MKSGVERDWTKVTWNDAQRALSETAGILDNKLPRIMTVPGGMRRCAVHVVAVVSNGDMDILIHHAALQ